MSFRPTSPSGTESTAGAATLSGILLAAGRGRRFGGDKLLAPLDDGTPVAVKAAENMISALARVVAVVRPADSILAALLRQAGAEVIVCPDASQGMGHSLASAVQVSQGAGGWLVGLADMPFIHPNTLRAVAKEVASGATIAAPCYLQKRGHPVAFAACWQAELLALSGDQGARGLIERQRDKLVLVQCDDAGVLLDIDLPADLVRGQHIVASQRQPTKSKDDD
ncbi:MAG TPA: nucleotidyltransferase family protein [Candidatus Tenderia sp.]|nr:nucleotidyltransferase family protein [Candidatus Tenderia sp.]